MAANPAQVAIPPVQHCAAGACRWIAPGWSNPIAMGRWVNPVTLRQWLTPVTLGLLLAAAALLWGSAHAADTAVPKLPDHATVGAANTELVLNGTGIRSIFGTKIYLIGMYLQQKATTAADAIAAEGPKRLHIVMLHDASASQVTDGLLKALARNNSAEDVAKLKDGIAQFRELLLSLGNVSTGTAFTIDYTPQGGTRLLIDKQPKGKAIAGADFSKAVLKIWLGERPTQQSVKDGLLDSGNKDASN